MIYDTFLYNGEEDMLEIRLNELKDVVDYFVICEATHTFSGKPKEISFIHKYDFPTIRLIYDTKPSSNPWKNEAKQREYLLDNLLTYDDDLILLSDVDEIPRADIIRKWRLCFSPKSKPIVLEMRWFYYYLNYEVKEKWHGTIIAQRNKIKSMEKLRRQRNRLPRISNAGWHFSFMGDIDSMVKKIESFSHQEFNKPHIKNKERITNLIKNKKDILGINREINYIPIDNTYPTYILENKEKFDKYIVEE